MSGKQSSDNAELSAVLDVLLRNRAVADALSRVGVFVVDYRTNERSFTDLYPQTGPNDHRFSELGSWLSEVHPEDRPHVQKLWQQMLSRETDVFNAEYRFRNPEGEYRWVRNLGTVVYRDEDGNGTLYIGADMDMSEVKEVEAQLADLALTDPHLGIPNRRGLEQQAIPLFAAAQRHGRSIGVVVFDIDHFREINERIGHTGADALMLEIIEQARGSIRAVDLIGRYGGDEFVVVLPDADEEVVQQVGTRILDAARAAGQTDRTGVSVSLGATAGIPRGDLGFWDYFNRADEQLFAAKAGGRARLQFSTSA